MQQDDDPFHPHERYERTYSRSLSTCLDALAAGRQPTTTANDHAIACALAGMSEAEAEACAASRQQRQQQQPDTSYDEELAQQLQDREADKLLLRPSSSTQRRARRRDRALRRLLRHLKPTALVPRLNPLGVLSPDHVSADRERLLLRLDMYGLTQRPMQGDGNCQFRALADQLFWDERRHPEVRQAVVDQLCSHPRLYAGFVTTGWAEYVNSMRTLGTWGDHLTLQAAADAYGVAICLLTSFLESCVISISPSGQQDAKPAAAADKHQQAPAGSAQEAAMAALQQSPQAGVVGGRPPSPAAAGGQQPAITLWLSFWAEVHYNSIAPKAASCEDDESASSSSEDEGGGGKVLGSSRLGRVMRKVVG